MQYLSNFIMIKYNWMLFNISKILEIHYLERNVKLMYRVWLQGKELQYESQSISFINVMNKLSNVFQQFNINLLLLSGEREMPLRTKTNLFLRRRQAFLHSVGLPVRLTQTNLS